MHINSQLQNLIIENIRDSCVFGNSSDIKVTFFIDSLARDFLPTINLFDFFFLLLDKESKFPDFLMFVQFKIKTEFVAKAQLQQVIVEGLLTDSDSSSRILKI